MKIHFISLGCSKNQVDSEQIMGLLLDHLPDTVFLNSPRHADLIFVNTCGFLRSAREESFSVIGKLYPKKTIILGCLTSLLSRTILKKYPHVVAVLRQHEYQHIPQLLHQLHTKPFLVSSALNPFDTALQSRYISPVPYAYIKIAEGCNNRCSYCLIPSLRGPYRSKPIENILAEATMLTKSGIKEIILIAQDTSYYGIDRYKKKMLPVLLQKLSALPALRWIRILYTYPDRIDNKLIHVMQYSKKIVPYLDIPFQHADPTILRQMNRPTDTQKWKRLILHLRKAIPHICLRTTFIVGFPGETIQQLHQLKTFMETMMFDRVGFFPYSREKGTSSYTLTLHISKRDKHMRISALARIQQSLSRKKNKSFIGSILNVMIESYDKQQKRSVGRSYRDAPEIDGHVYITGEKLTPGQFVTVTITAATTYDLFGEICKTKKATSFFSTSD